MKKTTTYRQSKQESLFEEEFTLKALSAMGNPLEQVPLLLISNSFAPHYRRLYSQRIVRLQQGVDR